MNIFSLIKKIIRHYIGIINGPLQQITESGALLTATVLANQNRARQRLKGLYEAEFSVYSQWGEDGIISWLIDCLPDIPHTFIEFGVENYQESNTRLLLRMRNWRGLVIDGSKRNIEDIKKQGIYWRHDLTAICAFIDRDNINNLIESADLSSEVGLLSVDIDGNDFWVWQSIEVVSPVIVVCEYNAVLGDIYPISIPYQASFQRTNADPSNLYFGASIRALILLGQTKGYTFVGTTSTGANAFFVRNDRVSQIISLLDGIYGFPSKFREARDKDGNLIYLNGASRREVIKNLPFVDPISLDCVDLSKLNSMYSIPWLDGEGCKF
jgi:hypothetical protein